MKKIIISFVVCFGLCISMITTSFAVGQMKIVAGDKTGRAGDTIIIPVSVKENYGFIKFTMNVKYNSSMLEYKGTECGPVLNKGLFSAAGNNGTLFMNYKNEVPKNTTVAEAYLNAGQIDQSGVLFNIKFKIIGTYEEDTKTKVEVVVGKLVKNAAPYFKPGENVGKYAEILLTVPVQHGVVLIKKSGDSEAKSKYSDLTGEYTSYTEYVEYLAEKGIIGGVGNGKFAPEKNVKRGDFVKMLAGVSGVDFSGDKYVTDQFSDVAKSHSYNKLIGWASAAGIVTGYGNKTFKMDNNITREDMAVMVYRLAQHMKVILPKRVDLKLFSDDDEISSYAKGAVTVLQQADIVGGSEFKSKVPATRADAAKMLALYMKLYS